MMVEKKKSAKKAKKNETVVDAVDLVIEPLPEIPEPNPVLIPKERLARLVAETNNFRIVEKFDEDTSKPYFEVVNRRTDDTQKFNTLNEASTFINSQGLR